MKRLGIALFTVALFAAPLAAFQPGQGEFVPISQLPASEQLPAAPLVLGAYAFVWVALLFYVFSIWRRLTKVESEMSALTARSERSRAR